MSLPSVKAAYFHGVADPSKIEPESYALDAAILTRLWNAEPQIDLKLDYKPDIARYPLYQNCLRRRHHCSFAQAANLDVISCDYAHGPLTFERRVSASPLASEFRYLSARNHHYTSWPSTSLPLVLFGINALWNKAFVTYDVCSML
jgi:hypothetical protein